MKICKDGFRRTSQPNSDVSGLTLGSLFDGSGGFPLAGLLSDIVPLWASEIEPFPIRVTTKNLPWIKHYGNICEMDGGKVEPVDIITFGSPCQDMSIAGKREGLSGNRSGLFYEAIRIIREMRSATNGEYPKYIVWENVPGAFSSNQGDDFRCVLESICKVVDETVSVPSAKKWLSAGEIVGDGYSVAWRVLNAEHFGVPQRRKRIYLVADFTDGCAGKILFESEGMPWDPPESFSERQGSSRGAGEGSETTGTVCLNDQGGERMDVTYERTATLCAKGHPPLVFENHSQDCRYTGPLDVAQTVLSTYGTGGNNQPFVAEPAYGLDRASFNQGKNAKYDFSVTEESEPTMTARGPNAVAQPVYTTSKASFHTKAHTDVADTLVASDFKDPPTILEDPYYIVRRLTPTECARLQGFPDWWCSNLGTANPSEHDMTFWRGVFETHRKVVSGVLKPKSDVQIRKWLANPHSDSAEYKMWGNGIALPCAVYVLSGIVQHAEKH